jgi:hypothetical protein
LPNGPLLYYWSYSSAFRSHAQSISATLDAVWLAFVVAGIAMLITLSCMGCISNRLASRPPKVIQVLVRAESDVTLASNSSEERLITSYFGENPSSRPSTADGGSEGGEKGNNKTSNYWNKNNNNLKKVRPETPSASPDIEQIDLESDILSTKTTTQQQQQALQPLQQPLQPQPVISNFTSIPSPNRTQPYQPYQHPIHVPTQIFAVPPQSTIPTTTNNLSRLHQIESLPSPPDFLPSIVRPSPFNPEWARIQDDSFTTLHDPTGTALLQQQQQQLQHQHQPSAPSLDVIVDDNLISRQDSQRGRRQQRGHEETGDDAAPPLYTMM